MAVFKHQDRLRWERPQDIGALQAKHRGSVGVVIGRSPAVQVDPDLGVFEVVAVVKAGSRKRSRRREGDEQGQEIFHGLVCTTSVQKKQPPDKEEPSFRADHGFFGCLLADLVQAGRHLDGSGAREVPPNHGEQGPAVLGAQRAESRLIVAVDMMVHGNALDGIAAKLAAFGSEAVEKAGAHVRQKRLALGAEALGGVLEAAAVPVTKVDQVALVGTPQFVVQLHVLETVVMSPSGFGDQQQNQQSQGQFHGVVLGRLAARIKAAIVKLTRQKRPCAPNIAVEVDDATVPIASVDHGLSRFTRSRPRACPRYAGALGLRGGRAGVRREARLLRRYEDAGLCPASTLSSDSGVSSRRPHSF